MRRPRGIYAVVIISEHIAEQRAINPSITDSELHAYFNSLYSDLLRNPAVSGLALEVKWSLLNPDPPPGAQAYDWSWMEDAFATVGGWNSQNPAEPPKTIQVTLTPGFNSPAWVLELIRSCDGLFDSSLPTPPSNCGTATFTGFVEGGGGVLPLPWNPTYKNAWKTFLTAFAAQYQTNPAFVSMDVGGPTAASTEMILPNNSTATLNQPQFGGITPNHMWLDLLARAYPGQPAYQKSDQAFIDEWNAAIDRFGSIFPGMTLVTWTGDGLPNLGDTGFTVPTAFQPDCPVPDMDCAAETTILSHFVDPTVDVANAKGAGEAGMRAVAVVGNLGVAAAKRLAQRTAAFTAPSAQILAGQQFAHSTANFPLQEGCTSEFPPNAQEMPAGCSIPSGCTVTKFSTACLPIACIPQACLAPGITPADLAGYAQFGDVPVKDLLSIEQAIYNVLRKYFDGTPVASFFGGMPGTAPLNYLQIYDADVRYAATHANAPGQVVQTDGTTVSMTAQDLLTLASQKLLEIAEPQPAVIATVTPTNSATPAATATLTPSPCVGDCSHDGAVTVDEIVTLAEIALGNLQLTACAAGDANQDGRITVDEILAAVKNALTGCV